MHARCEKGNSLLRKLLDGLSYDKIWRYNNSPPSVIEKMAAATDSSFNFLEWDAFTSDDLCAHSTVVTISLCSFHKFKAMFLVILDFYHAL